MTSAEYIVGLADGEGCFYVHVRPQRPHTSKPRVDTHFYIKLHEDDRPLLEEIKRDLGCGAVYRQIETRSNHSQCYRYEVNAQRDIHNVVIPFFEKHPLRSRKRKDFVLFREIALMVRQGHHKTPAGLRHIQALKSAMNHGARRVREIRTLGGNAAQP